MTDLESLLAAGPPVPAPPHERSLAEEAEREGLLGVAVTTIASPIGPLLLARTPQGVVTIEFLAVVDLDTACEHLAAKVSPRLLETTAGFDAARRELDEYFAGTRRRFDVPLDWRLTAGFHRKVLETTAAIPYGETSTYTSVAGSAGSPRASRAAGNALATNPIPIIVPCHRVLRTDGSVGGYRGGAEVKRKLLRLEAGAT